MVGWALKINYLIYLVTNVYSLKKANFYVIIDNKDSAFCILCPVWCSRLLSQQLERQLGTQRLHHDGQEQRQHVRHIHRSILSHSLSPGVKDACPLPFNRDHHP